MWWAVLLDATLPCTRSRFCKYFRQTKWGQVWRRQLPHICLKPSQGVSAPLWVYLSTSQRAFLFSEILSWSPKGAACPSDSLNSFFVARWRWPEEHLYWHRSLRKRSANSDLREWSGSVTLSPLHFKTWLLKCGMAQQIDPFSPSPLLGSLSKIYSRTKIRRRPTSSSLNLNLSKEGEYLVSASSGGKRASAQGIRSQFFSLCFFWLLCLLLSSHFD